MCKSQCGFVAQHSKIVKSAKITIEQISNWHRLPHFPYRSKSNQISLNEINISVFYGSVLHSPDKYNPIFTEKCMFTVLCF